LSVVEVGDPLIVNSWRLGVERESGVDVKNKDAKTALCFTQLEVQGVMGK
jgi:hypothetical protein